MDIRVLEYFLAVAREESITKAAKALSMTQPPLSRQLKELEDELGKQLFIRGNKKVTLTEEGILLRKRAEELIIMGLRLRSGIHKSDFKLCCGLDFDAFINQDFKNRCQEQGLLVDDATTLKATKEGFLLLNYLISGLCGA